MIYSLESLIQLWGIQRQIMAPKGWGSPCKLVKPIQWNTLFGRRDPHVTFCSNITSFIQQLICFCRSSTSCLVSNWLQLSLINSMQKRSEYFPRRLFKHKIYNPQSYYKLLSYYNSWFKHVMNSPSIHLFEQNVVGHP